MSIKKSTGQWTLTGILSGTLFVLAPAVAGASDCGCESHGHLPSSPAQCGCEAVVPDCGCEPECGCEIAAPECGCENSCDSPACGSKSGGLLSKKFNMKKTPLYRSLDAVAGGIEKVFSLHKGHSGCDEAACDDGCDAMMIQELMVPMPTTDHSMHHQHHSIDSMSVPQNYPIESPTQTIPMGQAQIPQPMPMESMPAPPTEAPVAQPKAIEVQPNTNPLLPPPEQAEPESSNEGSLFDALSDPFSDDEVRVRKFQPVRPSVYTKPIDTPLPLSRSTVSSRRRAGTVTQRPLSSSRRSSRRR